MFESRSFNKKCCRQWSHFWGKIQRSSGASNRQQGAVARTLAASRNLKETVGWGSTARYFQLTVNSLEHRMEKIQGSCCLRNSSSLALMIFRCVAAPDFHTLEEEVELEQWKKKTSKLRTRNVVTGLAIGALVLGIYGYTFYSVSQERIMDEIDEEAKRARLQGPKTGAN
ncbi:hypothetical protein ATANTOWER_005559 [Ataeniobius toweri]|uniref:Cytochrome c oxidase assembly factor 3 n=1 Tax=Ataeniobius toweri TaxID=208326 RepID=A0ABU7B6J1_9TELE|nr:hypothetical protein [Ataeniobius toweri]